MSDHSRDQRPMWRDVWLAFGLLGLALGGAVLGAWWLLASGSVPP